MIKPEIRHHLKMAKHSVKKQEFTEAIAHAAIGILMKLIQEDGLTKRTDFEIKPIVAEPPSEESTTAADKEKERTRIGGVDK